uniref:TonB-like protein n=1 Tax=mine drainage metagenome TaxID=410659 RepID=E6QMF1_9ZZZZ
MANDLMNPPEAEVVNKPRLDKGFTGVVAQSDEDRALEALMGRAFEQKGLLTELYENLHDIFFPPKLPPLELTSKPIPVKDPMATERSPLSYAISAGINIGILLLILFAFRHQIAKALPPKLVDLGNINIPAWKPVTPQGGAIGGGGGGGDHDLVNPIKGRLPKIEKNPIVTPQVIRNDHPKLAMEAAVSIQPTIKLPDNPALPNIGMLNSTNNVVLSNGQGSHGGMGSGSGGGLGSGSGNGVGAGSGGNLGGGVYRVGNGVSAPKVTYSVEAEFSDEARRAKYEGTVLIGLIVDAQGNPQNVHVVRSLGMGLDEKAMEAVRQYKFKPAFNKQLGKPVPVMMDVEVNFRLF